MGCVTLGNAAAVSSGDSFGRQHHVAAAFIFNAFDNVGVAVPLPKLMAPFHIVRVRVDVDEGAWPASSAMGNSVLGCLIYCEARYSRTLSAE